MRMENKGYTIDVSPNIAQETESDTRMEPQEFINIPRPKSPGFFDEKMNKKHKYVFNEKVIIYKHPQLLH